MPENNWDRLLDNLSLCSINPMQSVLVKKVSLTPFLTFIFREESINEYRHEVNREC
jgi:hypothetical protein